MKHVALGILALASIGGCVASAQFHSKNGQAYPQLTHQAVLCNETEAHAVVASGAIVIGTISAHGLTVNSTQADVADKAVQVAAESGGTHVVLTAEGVESYETLHPATVDRQCVRTDDGRDCQTTYTPETTTTIEKPTAQFIVLRLAPEAWVQVPESLRPAR